MARPSAIRPDEVDALVLAAGAGARLGLGPKAFIVMGGRSLLERAVEIVRECARRVLVGVPAEHVEHARRLCGAGTVVVPGGATRAETFRRLASLSVLAWSSCTTSSTPS